MSAGGAVSNIICAGGQLLAFASEIVTSCVSCPTSQRPLAVRPEPNWWSRGPLKYVRARQLQASEDPRWQVPQLALTQTRGREAPGQVKQLRRARLSFPVHGYFQATNSAPTNPKFQTESSQLRGSFAAHIFEQSSARVQGCLLAYRVEAA